MATFYDTVKTFRNSVASMTEGLPFGMVKQAKAALAGVGITLRPYERISQGTGGVAGLGILDRLRGRTGTMGGRLAPPFMVRGPTRITTQPPAVVGFQRIGWRR